MTLQVTKIAPSEAIRGIQNSIAGRNHASFSSEALTTMARTRAKIWDEYRPGLVEFFNSNTLDTDLLRIALLQSAVSEFAIPLLPLTSFCTVFGDVALEGTDKVGVPFYPLQTDASQSWAAVTGYGTASSSETDIREVAIGGDGTNSGSSAAANTAKDRKFQMLSFDSLTLRRQPFFKSVELVSQNAKKLGVDIFTDVVSRCITAASFGAAVKTVAAEGFSGDDVADLTKVANASNWSIEARTFTIDSDCERPLLADQNYRMYLAYPPTDPLRRAYMQNAYKFANINSLPNLSSYSPAGERLMGWVNHQSALLFATSPIRPSPEVRKLLRTYEIVIDPTTGATFEFRQFGDPFLDRAHHIIEASYGCEVGRASALKRICRL
jgi:hypothetical protein